MRILFLIIIALGTHALRAQEPNLKQKLSDTQLLAKAGKQYLETHDLHDSCHVFSVNPDWQKGDLAITLIRGDGTIFTNPSDRFSIWQNIGDYEEEGALPSIQRMEHDAGKYNELFIYKWMNDLKYASVEKVIQGNELFYITVGFYPLAKDFQTKYLIKSFIHLLREVGLSKALKNIAAPHFQRGVIFLGVYREDGTVMGHVDHPEWVGKNMIDLQDKKGVKIIQKVLEIAKTKEKGWMEYTWYNMQKRGYVQRYIDPETQTLYAVMAGYYPDIQKNMLPKFIQRAATYLTVNGQAAAIRAFNKSREFHYGPLQVILFDARGNQLTNTYKNNTFGREFFQKLLEEADKNKTAWIFGQDRQAEAGAYVEKLTVGGRIYYLATVYYLNSKKRSTELLVSKAVDFLQDTDFEDAMREFSNPLGRFIRGEQFIFVYDMTGRCLAHGDYHELIQRDLSTVTDQKGKLILEEIIEIARKQRRGWTSFNLRNSVRHIYVERVDKKIGKKEKSFIVGSGFWG